MTFLWYNNDMRKVNRNGKHFLCDSKYGLQKEEKRMFTGRIVKTLVLAVAFFAAGSLYLPGVSSAEDVWCCSHDGRSFYLDSESINTANLPEGMDYRVSVKAVLESDSSLEKTIIYGFESQNDRLVGNYYDKSAGYWQWVNSASEKPIVKAVWETMKPYMKQKHIGYSDTWKWD